MTACESVLTAGIKKDMQDVRPPMNKVDWKILNKNLDISFQ